jgi:hypothetical protein
MATRRQTARMRRRICCPSYLGRIPSALRARTGQDCQKYNRHAQDERKTNAEHEGHVCNLQANSRSLRGWAKENTSMAPRTTWEVRRRRLYGEGLGTFEHISVVEELEDV